MEFGIFSNGFRPHTTAAQTYDEDLAEIVHADELGFQYAFISEHHGEPVYIDKIDTLPVPELLMCKAAALTKQIRMGAAVKLIHLAASGRHRDPDGSDRPRGRRRPFHLRFWLRLPQSAVHQPGRHWQRRRRNRASAGRSTADCWPGPETVPQRYPLSRSGGLRQLPSRS